MQSHKVQHKQGKYQVSAVILRKLQYEIVQCRGCLLFFLSGIRKEKINSIMHIYRRFCASQPQLKVLNSNKRMVTHLLIEPER